MTDPPPPSQFPPPTPVTIITGFLGSGKTTLILNLIPQLPKSYTLALLKNEYGDLAVDSQLASSLSITGVRELLNGCICCNLVGQLSDALFELRNMKSASGGRVDRILIETSGSAFPATLAMEVNRIAREGVPEERRVDDETGEEVIIPAQAPGGFTLDGVVSVIDVENWKGYEDTSVTARMQAKFTDLIVFNKWELVDDLAFERCLDRVGDLGVETAWVKSERGLVSKEVLLGLDGALVSKMDEVELNGKHADHGREHENGEGHKHVENHQDEVEVLSVVLRRKEKRSEDVSVMKIDDFEDLLLSAPKDEIYRIKGLIISATAPADSTGDRQGAYATEGPGIYVLNWAFSRWTYTHLVEADLSLLKDASARLTLILARGESNKWKKKLEAGSMIALDKGESVLDIKRIS